MTDCTALHAYRYKPVVHSFSILYLPLFYSFLTFLSPLSSFPFLISLSFWPSVHSCGALFSPTRVPEPIPNFPQTRFNIRLTNCDCAMCCFALLRPKTGAWQNASKENRKGAKIEVEVTKPRLNRSVPGPGIRMSYLTVPAACREANSFKFNDSLYFELVLQYLGYTKL